MAQNLSNTTLPLKEDNETGLPLRSFAVKSGAGCPVSFSTANGDGVAAKTGDRGQKTEDRRQRTNNREQMTDFLCLTSDF